MARAQGLARGSVDHNALMSRSSTFGSSVFLSDTPAALSAASRRLPALVAGALWLVAGLSLGYWLLLAWGRSPVTPVAPVSAVAPAPDVSAVARALGALPEAVQAAAVAPAPVAVTVASRYALLGVVATGQAGGAALIGIDGQPPRPYRVGASLEGGLVLEAVSPRAVRLAPAPGAAGDAFELTLPEPPSAPS